MVISRGHKSLSWKYFYFKTKTLWKHRISKSSTKFLQKYFVCVVVAINMCGPQNDYQVVNTNSRHFNLVLITRWWLHFSAYSVTHCYVYKFWAVCFHTLMDYSVKYIEQLKLNKNSPYLFQTLSTQKRQGHYR